MSLPSPVFAAEGIWLRQESLRHIFDSPGYAPGTIAVNITWMERGFNACQTPRSMYLSIFNRFPVIQSSFVAEVANLEKRSAAAAVRQQHVGRHYDGVLTVITSLFQHAHWVDLFSTAEQEDVQLLSETERKRREAVWELFQSECVFLIDHLMVLKHVRFRRSSFYSSLMTFYSSLVSLQ